MTLELMPDGKTFKKLNKIQEKALKRYYKRGQDKGLIRDVALPVSLVVVGGIISISYIFKDELQQWLKDKEEDIIEWIKGIPKAAAVWTGEGMTDIITTVGDTLFATNPKTPEYITFPDREPIGPLTRCQRWENDANDVLAAFQSGNLTDTEITQAAIYLKIVIRNMKKEKCGRPTSISQTQWDDV